MPKEKNPNKLTLNPWKVILIFAITFLVFEAVFYLSFQTFTKADFWNPDRSFYFYTPFLFGASVFFCILSIKNSYYEIEGTKFLHYKMGKVVDYTWNNIIYIDQEFSEKKKMMLFYTKDGKEHILGFDKHGILYKTALDKCPLISKEEFNIRFSKKKM